MNAAALVRKEIALGRMVRGLCRDCGSPKTHGHHFDYNKPLEVIWLCGAHHRKEHARLRREGVSIPALPMPDLVLRWTDHDETLIRAIQLKLGITKVPELVRQSLRALADKEGLSA